MAYNPVNWYWSGSPGVYGSARAALVSDPSTDTDYLTAIFLGNWGPWPRDQDGNQTADALDAVLMSAGLPPTGLGSVTALATQLCDAASAVSDNIISQIVPAGTDAAMLYNAAMWVSGAGGIAPTVGAYATEFGLLATSYGKSADDFATAIVAGQVQSSVLGRAKRVLFASATAATTAGQLTTALGTFETARGNVVTALNSALPTTITNPPAISIPGL